MFTQELIAEIIAVGAIVLAITQAIKQWRNWDGWKALIISAVVAIALSLWRILSNQPYDWAKLVILAFGAFLESNGIYHFGTYAIGQKKKE